MDGLNSALSSYEPARINQPEYTDSAVVLALVEEQTLTIPFVKRTRDCERHPGEIGLPGGRRESTDTTLRITALRELAEETGVRSDTVR